MSKLFPSTQALLAPGKLFEKHQIHTLRNARDYFHKLSIRQKNGQT